MVVLKARRGRHRGPHGNIGDASTITRSSTTVARFQLTVSARAGRTRARTKPFEAPSNANVGTVPVFADDIIVMATDGLFDNVALETVAECVTRRGAR